MVFVVDDEESILSILQDALSQAKYQVRTFPTAEDALQAIQQEPPHVILSDIRMPGMSGIDLLNEVRNISTDIQFIIMTSHASLDTALQAIKLGAYDYLHKPFEDINDVIVTLDRTVEKLFLQYQNEQLLEELAVKNNSLTDLNARIAKEKEEVVYINSFMAEVARAVEIDDVLDVFLTHTSKLLYNKSILFFKHLPAYSSLLLYKAGGLNIEEYRGVGISLKEVPSTKYNEQIREPHALKPLSDLMSQVFSQTKFLAIPMILENEVTGILVTQEIEDLSLRRVFDSFVQVLSVSYYNAVMRKRMHEMAIKDPLTGLYNRRFYNQKLEEEISRSRRTRYPVSLIYMDIDHFKKYNDNNGHQNGDLLLKAISKLMQKTSRTSDIVARLGGEEFSIILPHTDLMGAAVKAEKLRKAVETTKFPFGELQPMGFISISIGVSEYPTISRDAEGLVKAADDALYKVKETSRNRVCVAQAPDGFEPDFIAEKVPAYVNPKEKQNA
jgi:diguanylate cyclase (GGDEF)-like protein